MTASTGFGGGVCGTDAVRQGDLPVSSKDSGAGLLARGACDTLRQKPFGLECLRKSLPAPMNVTTIPRTSPRMGLRVFVLMLAWVVMAGLSWADLIGVQAESHGVPPDAQWATEPDLDELRDDATTKVLTEDALPANHVLYASAISSSVPSSAQDIPLPTCDLLSTLSVYRL